MKTNMGVFWPILLALAVCFNHTLGQILYHSFFPQFQVMQASLHLDFKSIDVID